MSNLSGLFDDVNTQVGNIAQQVGTKPSSFEPRVFAMIEALSRNVVLPIAGVILTFIACYELIQMITEHNNMAQFEPALLMKWIFKTAISVWMISNTFDIIMAVFDVTQQVVANSSGIISGNTRVNDIGLWSDFYRKISRGGKALGVHVLCKSSRCDQPAGRLP